MATSTGNNLFARARVIATQTAGDANSAPTIDSLGAIRALTNHAIREVYRRQSHDQKFIRDTVTRHTVVIGGGEGACPNEIMREFLGQAQFQDDNNSLITYYNYNIDFSSDQNYRQLGYVVMQGDNFEYTAPAPDLDGYDGNLYVTVPSFPTFPNNMASAITFPSESVVDSIVLFLSFAILGKEGYQVVTA